MKYFLIHFILIANMLFLSACFDKPQESASDLFGGDSTQEVTAMATVRGKIASGGHIERSARRAASGNGSLLATEDKFKLALEIAEDKVPNSINIDANGSFVISNVKPTNNFSMTIYNDDKSKAVTLSEINVNQGEDKDLGFIALDKTSELNLTVISTNSTPVRLLIPTINYNKEVTPNTLVSIPDLPKGLHLLTLVDGNANTLTSQVIATPTTRMDINLTKIVGTSSISGEVLDSSGAAVAGAKVYLRTDSDSISMVLTKKDGRFDLKNIKNGTYSLFIAENGYAVLETKNLVLNGTPKDVGTLTLLKQNKTGSISGYAFYKGREAHAGMDITLERDGVTTNQLGTLSDGSFLINDLEEGTYHLNFGKESDSDYSFLRSGDIVVTAGVVTIMEASIKLVKLYGAISGFVSIPASFGVTDNLQINVYDTQDNVKGTASVNSDGSFRVNDVLVGNNYRVELSGTDINANQIVTKSIDMITVNASQKTVLDQLLSLEFVNKYGSISGTLDVPASFGEMDQLRLEVVDKNNVVVAVQVVTESGDFRITHIPVDTGYTLQLTGTDIDNNQVITKKSYDVAVEVDTTTVVSKVFDVELRDPNPPVIHSITYESSIKTTTSGELIINPSIETLDENGNIKTIPSYINFEVTATDADAGDVISYEYNVTDGQIVSSENNKMRFQAPTVGTNLSVRFKVKSNARVDEDAYIVQVNHFPEITLLSPSIENLKDDTNVLTLSSLDVVNIIIKVEDFEDGYLDDNNITWFSNLQGEIGKGKELITSLRPGLHKIQAHATDSNNLTKVSDVYYVKVTTPDEIVLKVMGKDVDLYSKALPASFDLNISAPTVDLVYESSDENVMTVDSDGIITGVGMGAAKVKIHSLQSDENNVSFYQTEVVVRVIGLCDSTTVTEMKANGVCQIDVDANTLEKSILFSNLPKGHYVVKIFDQVALVPDSSERSSVVPSGVAVTELFDPANTIAVHTFEVIDTTANNYELYLQPDKNSSRSQVKVALYPGTDLRDVNGSLKQNYTNGEYEPNDTPYIAASIPLQKTVINSLSENDMVDYYTLDVIAGRYYAIELTNVASSYDKLTLKVGNEVDLTKYLNVKTIYRGGTQYHEFLAEKDGKVFIEVGSVSYNKYHNFSYKLRLLPATGQGLIQNEQTFEPNNTQHTAYNVDIGPFYATGIEGGSNGEDHIDVYSFEAKTGVSYSVGVHSISGNLYVYVGNESSLSAYYSPNFVSLGRGSTRYYTVTPLEDGKVYLTVRSDNAGFYDRYFGVEFQITSE